MTIRSIPGSLKNHPPDREFRYLSDDGRVPFGELFRQLTSTASPRKATHGGAVAERCRLALPDGSFLQALSYRGDVQGWREDIEGVASALGLVLGRIEADRVVISDGRSFALSDCKATFYLLQGSWMHSAYLAWDGLVELVSPTMGDALRITRWSEASRVFNHSDLLWLIGENLVAELSVKSAPGSGTEARVARIHLPIRARFFSSRALVQTTDLPPLRMLGKDLPCTAAEMEAHLTDRRSGRMTIQVESNTVRIYEGRTEFTFEAPGSERVEGMERTWLASVSRTFGAPIEGELPTITRRT